MILADLVGLGAMLETTLAQVCLGGAGGGGGPESPGGRVGCS